MHSSRTSGSTRGSDLAAGTGASVSITECQVCDNPDLKSVLFLGYLPPVNQMWTVGERPKEQPAYPAQLLFCPNCKLTQLGLIVDPEILFPPEYPYTSGTTRILRENFAQLYEEAREVVGLETDDLIVDIGSNDGTLLSNFRAAGHRVHGVEPADVGHTANERGIKTTQGFFGPKTAAIVGAESGRAKIITATNVFAHIEDVHQILESLLSILKEDGVFISESHHLLPLIETLQYDTIYHEHLRYYSLGSVSSLLRMHGLEVFHAARIPTHGGSIRVYAARKGTREIQRSVAEILELESRAGLDTGDFEDFAHRVLLSKLQLHEVFASIKREGDRVYGIGAPSRASTLINYVGLDDALLDCVLEIAGSLKIGKYMPGTLIPVLDEEILYSDQPEYALLLSWHIADELIPKIQANGFKGKFIVPLPEPRIIDQS